MRKLTALVCGFAICLGLCACGAGVETLPDMHLEDEAVALLDKPAINLGTIPQTGKTAKVNTYARIDYSHLDEGYVMAEYLANPSGKRVKAQVKGPTTTYTYDMPVSGNVAFPLSDGNGQYKIMICRNTTGTKYAVETSVTIDVKLKDEFAPFLTSNQYVNFADAPVTVETTANLCDHVNGDLEKVKVVYTYVMKTLSYDKDLAANVKSGYVPNLDLVLSKGKGICFDYAALMTGMLRSQGVPCKLVVGYAGKAYHAWISVYTKDNGWVNGVICFNGKTWQHMDPTFADSGNQNKEIMKYIGNGENYTAKYFY